jgi:hypothetical protein
MAGCGCTRTSAVRRANANGTFGKAIESGGSAATQTGLTHPLLGTADLSRMAQLRRSKIVWPACKEGERLHDAETANHSEEL